MSEAKPTQHIIQVEGITVQAVVHAPTIKIRAQLVWQHMVAAARSSATVGSLELTHAGAALGPHFDEIFNHAAQSVVSAAAGVEAYANQIFADRAKHFAHLNPVLLDEMWRDWIEKRPALAKLQLALMMKSLPAIPKGTAPYQDVAAVFELRNALVHFKPEWSDEREEHEKVEKKLASAVSRSPFYPEKDPLFPMAWASHKSTVWAVDSCVALIGAVSTLLGEDPTLAERLAKLER